MACLLENQVGQLVRKTGDIRQKNDWPVSYEFKKASQSIKQAISVSRKKDGLLVTNSRRPVSQKSSFVSQSEKRWFVNYKIKKASQSEKHMFSYSEGTYIRKSKVLLVRHTEGLLVRNTKFCLSQKNWSSVTQKVHLSQN